MSNEKSSAEVPEIQNSQDLKPTYAHVFIKMHNFRSPEKEFSENQWNMLTPAILQLVGEHESTLEPLWNGWNYYGVKSRIILGHDLKGFVRSIISTLEKFSFILGPVDDWARFRFIVHFPRCPFHCDYGDYWNYKYCPHCGNKNVEAVEVDLSEFPE